MGVVTETVSMALLSPALLQRGEGGDHGGCLTQTRQNAVLAPGARCDWTEG